MGNKTTWKKFHIERESDFLNLHSDIWSMNADAYRTEFDHALLIIETNMPIRLARLWFSFVGVPFPSGYISADKPSWEIYTDDPV